VKHIRPVKSIVPVIITGVMGETFTWCYLLLWA